MVLTDDQPRGPRGVPSNPVYARVGDTVLRAARDGVRRNLTAKDIVHEIRAELHVSLSVGELRLLRFPTDS